MGHGRTTEKGLNALYASIADLRGPRGSPSSSVLSFLRRFDEPAVHPSRLAGLSTLRPPRLRRRSSARTAVDQSAKLCEHDQRGSEDGRPDRNSTSPKPADGAAKTGNDQPAKHHTTSRRNWTSSSQTFRRRCFAAQPRLVMARKHTSIARSIEITGTSTRSQSNAVHTPDARRQARRVAPDGMPLPESRSDFASSMSDLETASARPLG